MMYIHSPDNYDTTKNIWIFDGFEQQASGAANTIYHRLNHDFDFTSLGRSFYSLNTHTRAHSHIHNSRDVSWLCDGSHLHRARGPISEIKNQHYQQWYTHTYTFTRTYIYAHLNTHIRTLNHSFTHKIQIRLQNYPEEPLSWMRSEREEEHPKQSWISAGTTSLLTKYSTLSWRRRSRRVGIRRRHNRRVELLVPTVAATEGAAVTETPLRIQQVQGKNEARGRISATSRRRRTKRLSIICHNRLYQNLTGTYNQSRAPIFVYV